MAEDERVYGMKIGEGKSKQKIQGMYKDENGLAYFKVLGKTEPVPRHKLIENDPMALVLYYERNLKFCK